MTAFLLTMIALVSLSTVGKVIHLAREEGDRETPRGCDAFDVIVGVAVIVWAAVLL